MVSETVTINMDAEVVRKLRKLAAAQKQKKGFMGKVISEATKKYLHEREQEAVRRRALERLRKGYHMGKLKIKHRSELYDRI